MNEYNEESVLMPLVGDIWERGGIPECIILSVGKNTLEYVDEKIYYGPGIWEWDLDKYKVMPLGSLKRYLCKKVSLDEEPFDWIYSINRKELATSVVERHMRKMNREKEEDKKEVEVEHGDFKLRFNKSGEGISKLSNKDTEIEISLSDIWALSEKSYELANQKINRNRYNEGVNNE